MPGNCIGHISEDLSTMISPEVYEEIFLPALKECVAPYDIAMMHTHALGHKMLPIFAGIDKLKVIEISEDPKCPAPVDILRMYKGVLRDKVVMLLTMMMQSVLWQ